MRAVIVRAYGSPPDIAVEEVAAPQLQPGQVRLRVHAVGFGFPDALMIAGKYQFKPALPFTPGSEVAGRIIDAASDVLHLQPGMRVLVMSGQGGLAEEIVCPASSCILLPDGMDFARAAGLLVNYGTAYHALVQRANLRPGETLLVLGAAGGVGLAAVELGKAMGARVLAAGSTDEKLRLVRQYGADAGFNYTNEAIKAKVMEFTADRGIDVVFDPVGGALAEQCVRSMAWNGRYLVIGFAGGDIPSIPLNLALLKGCALVGVFWGNHTRREPDVHAANVKALFKLFEEGKIRPCISEMRGLESVSAALAALNGRQATGKIVIRVASDDA